MFSKFGLLALISMMGTQAWASGPGSSGGGNAVVCFDDPTIPLSIRDPRSPDFQALTDEMIPHVTSVEVLDLYEARLPKGLDGSIHPDVYPMEDNETPVQYVWKLAQRFNPSAPAISWILSDSIEAFSETHTTMESHGLERIDDTKMVEQIDSRNCVVATMAAQYKTGQKDYRLHIDKRLFNHPTHSKLSQAILLVHESVYRYFRDQGETDSRHARDLVTLMIRNHNLDQYEVYAELKALNVHTDQWEWDHEINRGLNAALDTVKDFQSLAAESVEKTEAAKIKPLVHEINLQVAAKDRCESLSECLQMILYKTSKSPNHIIPARLERFYQKANEIIFRADDKVVDKILKDRWAKEVATQKSINQADGLTDQAFANLIHWSHLMGASTAMEFMSQMGRPPLTDDQILEHYLNTDALRGQMIPSIDH